MAVYKYIYWRPDMGKDKNGNLYANVHLLVGYNQAKITDYIKMADEMRQTFPQAENKDIGGGQVTKSSYCQGFTLISWSAYLPPGEYLGWYQVENGRTDYCWAGG
jgi:hypothetical protein